MTTSSDAQPAKQPSPDDLYILYTGGTTGMPKGVLWRSADIYMAAMGGRKLGGEELASIEEVAEYAANSGGTKAVIGPPLMHGAAQWASFINFGMGNAVVIPAVNTQARPARLPLAPSSARRRSAAPSSATPSRGRILDQLAARKLRPVVALRHRLGRRAALGRRTSGSSSSTCRHVTILDSIGSSETGAQASNPSSKDSGVSTGDFKPGVGRLRRLRGPQPRPRSRRRRDGLVRADRARPARLLRRRREDGAHLPGDRRRALRGARRPRSLPRRRLDRGAGPRLGDHQLGRREDLRRGSRAALKHHPGVFDCVVAGRPSERWGQEVVAIVQLRAGAAATEARPARRGRTSTSPATSCRRRSSSATTSSAARAARPTTAGRNSKRKRAEPASAC